MRRARTGAGAVAVLFLLAPLLLTGVAGAADDSYAGTYKGWGEGTGKGGGKATSAVTIWVQDLGETVRFTIKAARLGVAFDFEGPEQRQGDDTVTVPVNVKRMGIRAKGTITLERDGDDWILSGSGKGKVLTYEGTGTVLAVRTATGVKVPGVADQITGGLEALFGGPPAAEEAPPEATKGDTLQPPEPPAQVEEVEPASALAAAEAAPPMPEDDKWVVAMVLIIVLLSVTGLWVFI
ncbi:MAG TPA: hypothetical protein VLA35_04715 [Thermoleophilia bacterium]|nr:hypothetical protein [Thermoleophilia bacterium]